VSGEIMVETIVLIILIVQAVLMIPISILFVVFNRRSKDIIPAWDFFWISYAANRIIAIYKYLKGYNIIIALSESISYSLQIWALLVVIKFYSDDTKKYNTFFYLPIPAMVILKFLGVYNWYYQALGFVLLGIVMAWVGLVLIKSKKMQTKFGRILSWVVFFSGIQTALYIFSRNTVFALIRYPINILLAFLIFIYYLLYRIDNEVNKRVSTEQMLNNMAENISDHLSLRINERGEILYSTPSMNNFVSSTKELSRFLRGFDEDDRKKFLTTFEDSLFFGRQGELDLSIKPEGSSFEKRFLVKFYPTKYLGTKVVDVFFLDITEQLRRENFLKKQKEEAELLNKSQAAFFSNISHELRTPLTIILGYSEMLYEIVGPAERRMVSMIADSANYLLKLVNDILDISKITSRAVKVEPESVNIKLLVNNILEQFISLVEKKGIKLESKLMICRENFVTDKTKLQRILTNLIGNAIKFTNEGVVRVLVKEEGSNVFLFAVEDTGIGIKKEYQDKVFERFVQIKDDRSRVKFKKGTGLGLPLTKELVQLLGGRIWLQSEYGKGTTVYFTLKELNHSEEKQKGDKNG